jgi:ATP-binding cassette subfamily B protein/subfamily B ATP-binding cassette protein MsbA
VIACFISWQLTLMFLVLVPIAGLVLGKVGRLMKQATRRVLERMASIFKILQESFQSIRVVKAFTMEPYERRRFCVATKDYCEKSQKVINIDALASPIVEVLGMIAVAGALLAGSYLVLRRHTHLFGMRMTAQPMEAETLLQLYVLLAAVADPVRKLSSVFTRIQSAGAAADRIFAYVDRQPKVRGNGEGTRLTRLVLTDAPVEAGTGKTETGIGRDGTPLLGVAAVDPHVRPGSRPYIEFRNVCFSYDSARPGEPEKVILEHINLTVRAGETVALVGPNGCGKSTLVGLIPRFYDPNYGSVLIDGHDLRSLHLRSLRQQIGLVTQDPILFADTIYNNIAYGSRGATAEQIETAARQASAHDFIVGKPEGYQTLLSEAGTKISGGEKQRIALARAILRNPSIIILDEFTSQMDAEKDAEIHQAMRTFLRGRTAFVITHRMHTLEIADRIVVLDKGRIVATGTHTELMASCPLYLRLQEAYNHSRRCA